MGPITPTTKGRVNINNGTIHYNPKDHQRTAQTGKHSQLYLRVITIADLTDPKSSTIPYGMLTGDWQAGSDLLWPDISCPPKQCWATFRKCIRATFSTLAPKYQPSHFSIRLDRMLRPWHAVPKHMVTMLQIGFTTFPAATRHTSHINNDSIQSEGILPRHRNNHSTPPHKPPYPAAWIISTGDTKHLSATFLMTNISSYTSHRIELEGIFHTLHHLDLLNITPKMVEQWCDNKQAVKDSTTTLNGPSMMIKVEADTILAMIHHLCNRFPFHTNIQHKYGHQDTRKSKRHNYQDETSCTVEADTPPNNPHPNPPVRTEPIPKPVQYPQQPPLTKGPYPSKSKYR